MTSHPYPLKELIDVHNDDIRRQVNETRLQKRMKKEQQKTSSHISKEIGRVKSKSFTNLSSAK